MLVRNEGETPWEFQLLLHTYFKVKVCRLLVYVAQMQSIEDHRIFLRSAYLAWSIAHTSTKLVQMHQPLRQSLQQPFLSEVRLIEYIRQRVGLLLLSPSPRARKKSLKLCETTLITLWYGIPGLKRVLAWVILSRSLVGRIWYASKLGRLSVGVSWRLARPLRVDNSFGQIFEQPASCTA